ncbi:MAG TPA: gliding motility-associated C-terminal domain-containing protein, partial [Flavobacteriales bacterium]|nr:gliding motility-associated C-terminal domain-containing protein [Flavobacteriales bacterium]
DTWNAGCQCIGTPINFDCAGVANGTASVDACGVCSGGTTGITPNSMCLDCAGVVNGTASVDACGVCSGGTTGITPNSTCLDCAGVANGTASVDACGVCSGGTTGITPNSTCLDCAGVVNGTASVDACGVCSGGTTGLIANASCTDCLGVVNGTNTIGSSCDDGDPDTSGDVWNSNCNCVGATINCSSDAGPDQATCATTLTMAGIGEGIWSGPTQVVFTNTSDPNTTITCSTPGVYILTWTVTIPGCTASDEISVTFNSQMDPSFNYGTNVFCQNTGTTTPQTVSPNGSFSAGVGLVIDPVTGTIDPSNSTAGTYTITHSIMGNCPTSSDQQVEIVTSFDAGWSAPVSICGNASPVDLNALITGDPGGTWSGPGVIGNMFSPAGLSGILEVTYTAGTGACAESWSSNIAITSVPVANAGPDATVCGYEHDLSALVIDGQGTWSGQATFSPTTTDPVAHVTVASYGTYTMTWTVTNNGCSASDICTVVFHDPGSPISVDAGPDQNLEEQMDTHLQSSSTPGAQVLWTVLEGSGTFADPTRHGTNVRGMAFGRNVFLIHAFIGDCQSAWDTLVVNVGELFIPQGYSPNGDGHNDRFEITGMAAYPGSKLAVFNRWGQMVYENDSYANDWDGHSKNGHELPNDTYFYVLNLSGKDTYNGFVVIKR